MKYRVWNVINPPNKPKFFPVETPEDGLLLIDDMTDEQLKNDGIFSNAFGLEVFEDGEWTEWYDEFGNPVEDAFPDV